MTPQSPYSEHLGDRDPLRAVRETTARIAARVSKWTAADFERSHAPGKWTAGQILVHLAHVEMSFGVRVRMALATPNYVVQPFDQDEWMAHEPKMGGQEALGLLSALALANVALYESLSPAERATPVMHPEHGQISVDWIIRQGAGHLIHHLKQLEQIK